MALMLSDMYIIVVFQRRLQEVGQTVNVDVDGPAQANFEALTTREVPETSGYRPLAPQRSVCTVKVTPSVTKVTVPCSLVT